MKKYFPILMSKSGELRALSQLSPAVKEILSPVIRVIPTTIDSFIKFFPRLEGISQLFLDFSQYKPSDTNTIDDIITLLQITGIDVVPVIYNKSEKPYYELLDKLIGQKTISSICLRFTGKLNFDGLTNALEANKIEAVADLLVNNKKQVSLWMDLGYVTQEDYEVKSNLAALSISAVADAEHYSNIIVSSGSFPKDLTQFKASDQPHSIIRFEWDIWQRLLEDANMPSNLRYADFGTKHPIVDESTAQFAGTASIRYTLKDKYLIYKGVLPKSHPLGNGQYVVFAHKLVKNKQFYGEGFSSGDAQVLEYSKKNPEDPRVRPGGAGTWVEISQNHHITAISSIL